MKKVKVGLLIISLFTLLQFTSCTEKFNIKIVTEDDSSYVHFDSLSFFPKSNIDWRNDKWQKEWQEIISNLYIDSDRGKKQFEYVFYVNKEGKYEKVMIVKGLNDEIDKQFVNHKVKTPPGKGKQGDKIVQYKTVVNNSSLNFPDWKNLPAHDIPILRDDDNSYIALSRPEAIPFDSTKVWSSGKKENYQLEQYRMHRSIPNIIMKSRLDLQYLKNIFIDDLDLGFTIAYHWLYVNEKGQLEKIRQISCWPQKLDDLLISLLPTIKFPKYDKNGKGEKYKFILKSKVLKNYKNDLADVRYDVNYDEDAIIASVEKKDKEIKIIKKNDSTFVNFSELDNINQNPMAFFWSGAFPILDEETRSQYEKMYNNINRDGNLLFYADIENEFRFTLFFDTDGLVEKVKIDNGNGDKLNDAALKIIENIIFIKGKINDKPSRYLAEFKIRFSPAQNAPVEPPYFHAVIMNPLFGKGIHELQEPYIEKDFLVLPDVSAKPIGGYSTIAEKVKYPDLAIRYKREGEVSVKTYLDEEGKVVGVQVLKTQGYGFDESAVEAIKKTRFKPAYQNGKAIKSIYVVPIEFILDSGEIKVRREQIDAYQEETITETKKESQHEERFEPKNTFFVSVEEMPEPIGGVKGIQNKLIYPKIARLAGVEGRVFIKAYIGVNGDVEKTEIIKGIGAGCDEEAMRAIKETKFKPGKQNGMAVKVQVSIPILFSLKSTDYADSTKHFGKWIGKSEKDEEIKITFYENGFTDLYKSKSGRMNGKVSAAGFWPMYKINYITKPYELDLIFVDSNKKVKGTHFCILEYEGSTEMKIGIQKEFDKRPKNFSKAEVGEVWSLHKVED